MRETITVNGIDCDVDYNDLIFSREDIVKMLTAATADKSKLDSITEFELRNHEDVASQTKPKNVETRKVDCTNYMEMANFMGFANNVAMLMKKTFGFTEAKDLGNNVYELTGTKKAFASLKNFL